MIEIFMAIIGIISAGGLIPQLIKILKTKSSKDLSVLSQILGLFFQSCWLFYAFYNNLPAMIVAGCVWLSVLITILIATVKYRRG